MSGSQHRRCRKSKGIRGYYAYAKLMRTLLEGDSSTDALAEKHGLKHTAVAEILRRLHQQKVVHIARWDRYNLRGCGHHEVWALGEGRDAPRPVRVDGRTSLRKPVALPFRPQIFNFGMVMLALFDGHTAVSIEDLTGIDRHCMDDLLKFMKNTLHLVHIPEWHRNPTGSPSPVFKLGDKRNAPRPKPLPTEGRGTEYRRDMRVREEWRSLLHLTAAPLAAAAHA